MNGSGETVLVTGGTGFLGGWCIASLLERGYDVRTTVRDLARERAVRDTVEAAGVDPGSRLEVLAADLTSDAGWAEAVAGCRYVLHVASPFPPVQPKDPDELIVPARDGALRVLRAALDAGVERVAMTSSVAAIRSARESSAAAPYTEADWTDGATPSARPMSAPRRSPSKPRGSTRGQPGPRTAWRRSTPAPSSARRSTTTTPTRSRRFSGCSTGCRRCPGWGSRSWTSATSPTSTSARSRTRRPGGERFIATDRFLWMADVAAVLRERLGDAAKKVPTRVAPNLAIRAMALFDGSIRSVVSDLGRQSWFSSEKARGTLGWETRPVEDSIEDCARSLI